MAEAILKSEQLPQVEVRSAGIYAIDGQAASRFAREVLEEEQIYQQHRSKQLAAEDVQWATHILTMTESHATTIRSIFPEHRNKIFTLKEFVGMKGQSNDVLDPYGGSKNDYYNTFNELKSLLDFYVNKIK